MSRASGPYRLRKSPVRRGFDRRFSVSGRKSGRHVLRCYQAQSVSFGTIERAEFGLTNTHRLLQNRCKDGLKFAW